MKIETIHIDGKAHIRMLAGAGKTFRRIHDGFGAGPQITLGIDFSTGIAREDLPEYYEQTDLPAPEHEASQAADQLPTA